MLAVISPAKDAWKYFIHSCYIISYTNVAKWESSTLMRLHTLKTKHRTKNIPTWLWARQPSQQDGYDTHSLIVPLTLIHSECVWLEDKLWELGLFLHLQSAQQLDSKPEFLIFGGRCFIFKTAFPSHPCLVWAARCRVLPSKRICHIRCWWKHKHRAELLQIFLPLILRPVEMWS